ncbi:MAG: type VII toxin-antitoxin system HepT family RNase toxin [Polyangiaceae bacterium]
MTNVALVARKLAVLEDHLQRLRERRPAEVVAFATDRLLQDAVAMSVLVVVQEAMDIALHIATDEGWELASTYREAFAVLERHGVITAPLAVSLGGAAQLRNRIAHGYASLDAERLWTELPQGIASFGEFAAAVSVFLQRAP